MATTVSRSLPDGIGQGHRPMPDQLASAIRSLSGDNAIHVMTGTSQGTSPGNDRSPVIGDWFDQPVTGRTNLSPVNGDRSGRWSDPRITGQRRPVRPTGHPSTETGQVTGPTHRSPVQPTSQRRPVRSSVRPTGHRSSVTDDRSDSPVTGHLLLMSGHWSVLPVTGQYYRPVTGHWSTCTDH